MLQNKNFSFVYYFPKIKKTFFHFNKIFILHFSKLLHIFKLSEHFFFFQYHKVELSFFLSPLFRLFQPVNAYHVIEWFCTHRSSGDLSIKWNFFAFSKSISLAINQTSSWVKVVPIICSISLFEMSTRLSSLFSGTCRSNVKCRIRGKLQE